MFEKSSSKRTRRRREKREAEIRQPGPESLNGLVIEEAARHGARQQPHPALERRGEPEPQQHEERYGFQRDSRDFSYEYEPIDSANLYAEAGSRPKANRSTRNVSREVPRPSSSRQSSRQPQVSRYPDRSRDCPNDTRAASAARLSSASWGTDNSERWSLNEEEVAKADEPFMIPRAFPGPESHHARPSSLAPRHAPISRSVSGRQNDSVDRTLVDDSPAADD